MRPICESGDIAAKERRLPAIEPGNAAAVLNSGAYEFLDELRGDTEILINGSGADVVPARLIRALTARSITHRLR